ncbi:hypothetical protein [Desulfosarcina cetonica]|uniref:hypothetical protein n=1 Tax=Desulfosarcina cetonica TaxID=90730 RepID=UPI001FEF6C78|nr:hypothetical protein [Desulfosarcina cetonica]
MIQLNSKDRAFFSLVDQAVSANPFSQTRAALDLKISGGSDTLTVTELAVAVFQKVRSRIDTFVSRTGGRIQDFDPKDRPLVTNVFYSISFTGSWFSSTI